MALPLTWLQTLEAFILILARIVGFFVVSPLFGGRSVPFLTRIGLAAVMAAILLGPLRESLPRSGEFLAVASPAAALVLAGELLVGAALGFIVLLFFSAVQLAGLLVDLPLGFGMANVLDPQTEVYGPVLGQFHFTLAFLVFFTINGHHGVLRALADSYQVVPLGTSVVTGLRVQGLVDTLAQTFLLGVRIALPLMVAAFLTDVALAIVSRAVPQVNVFITGFPLKVMAGMLVLGVILPAYVALLSWVFGETGPVMRSLWTFLRGG